MVVNEGRNHMSRYQLADYVIKLSHRQTTRHISLFWVSIPKKECISVYQSVYNYIHVLYVIFLVRIGLELVKRFYYRHHVA